MLYMEIQEGKIPMSQKPWFRKLGSTAACVKRAVLAAKLQLTLHNLGDEVFQPDVIIQNLPSELYSNVQRGTDQDGDSDDDSSMMIRPRVCWAVGR